MSAQDQCVVVFSGVSGHLDKMVTSEIPHFEVKYLEYMKSNHIDMLNEIRDTGILTEKNRAALNTISQTFIKDGGFSMK